MKRQSEKFHCPGLIFQNCTCAMIHSSNENEGLNCPFGEIEINITVQLRIMQNKLETRAASLYNALIFIYTDYPTVLHNKHVSLNFPTKPLDCISPHYRYLYYRTLQTQGSYKLRNGQPWRSLDQHASDTSTKTLEKANFTWSEKKKEKKKTRKPGEFRCCNGLASEGKRVRSAARACACVHARGPAIKSVSRRGPS